MNRFGILVAGLITVSVALILTARMMGSFSPRDASYTAYFVNDDGSDCDRPCVFGIEPGQTAFTDAVSMLQALPRKLQTDISSGLDWVWVRSRDLYVGIRRDAGVPLVASSELYLAPVYSLDNEPSIKTTLGETVARWGAPVYIRLESISGTPVTVLYYRPNIRLVFRRADPNFVGMNDRFMGLSLYSDLPDVQSRSSAWNGFTTARHYLDLIAAP